MGGGKGPPSSRTKTGGEEGNRRPAGEQQRKEGGAPGKGSSSSVFLIIPLLPLSSPRRALNENEEGYRHHPTNPILYGAKAYGGKERTDEGGKEEDMTERKKGVKRGEKDKRERAPFFSSLK